MYTPLPNEEERIAIAKMNTADLSNNLSEEDYVEIAHKTKGYVANKSLHSIKSIMDQYKPLHQQFSCDLLH